MTGLGINCPCVPWRARRVALCGGFVTFKFLRIVEIEVVENPIQRRVRAWLEPRRCGDIRRLRRGPGRFAAG